MVIGHTTTEEVMASTILEGIIKNLTDRLDSQQRTIDEMTRVNRLETRSPRQIAEEDNP